MAKDRDIELNPRFFVPPNVVDVRQENQTDYEYVYATDPGSIAIDGPVLQFPNSPVPNAPSTYTLISQKIRITADGNSVVDVELDFPDTGMDIDVRVTPE